MSWRTDTQPLPSSYLSLLYEDEEEALALGSEEEFSNESEDDEMSWRTDKQPLPSSYHSLLYEDSALSSEARARGSEKNSSNESEDDEDIQLPNRSADVDSRPRPVVLAEAGPAEADEEEEEERPRSRSPLNPQPHDEISESSWTSGPGGSVVLAVYNEDGSLMYQDETESFIDPDMHLIFPPIIERMDVSGQENVRMNVEGRGRRGRVRVRGGVRGRVSARGRGRPRGQAGAQRGVAGRDGKRSRWAMGDPLREVYMDDEDVPDELKCMVRDIILNRQRARERDTRMRTEIENIDIEEDDVYEDAMADPEVRQFSWQPAGSFVPVPEKFIPRKTGARAKSSSPYDAFRRYWGDDILQHIVDETNRYADTITSSSFRGDWYDTNHHEILCLFAFWMMLGVIRMPTIKSCFSRDPLLHTSIFKSIFNYRRYTHLTRALHFFDSAHISSDKLCRLRPVITHLNSAFKRNYIPKQQICIDESLTLWKGKLGFKNYIKTKAAKFGIKTFELCESASGYLWSFLVDTGKQNEDDAPLHSLKSTHIVLKLVRPLLNKGYQLFMDNWFNSPLLARILKRNGTDCIGTLRPSRQDVPPLVHLAKLKQGEIVARHSGDVCVMAWQDKKTVTTLSTCHGSATGLPTVSSRLPYRPIAFKPQVVLDYNRNMGGVDLKDQMLEPYLIERKKCMKWYMKLFKRLLNCSILNSRILLASSTQVPQDHLAFRLRLVDDILKNHLEACPRLPPPITSEKPVGGHWPYRVKQRDADTARHRKSTQKCVVCLREGRKNVKTPLQCEACAVPLCAIDCFKSYHS